MISIFSDEVKDSSEELQPCFLCGWKPVSGIKVVKLENDRELKICENCLSKAKEDEMILGKKIKEITKAKRIIDEQMQELREWEREV
ncbi:MAG: hypothetical protein KGY45_03610 [Hadesarchaea archaeon]|nr:hypothetical protein [Hadesarchaea archaeon]